ncbi:hypothetical protein EUTSA_v10001731mg [Eutrema salsugineum]|uniref:Uncharacterized protein n=1 Tax=Eutrema salsugineum TaxID=72664 RepID=V4LHP3_EUTSA|nr:uncharacterized protein LOC18015757 [Eutrema salsugineum]ESQ39308.1 hypothetical protein EUTSA_v10001731mg [Eutrema salsugineum]
MSNVRPWFRLSSIARPTSQGSSDPPPPPQPRPTPRRQVTVRPPVKQPSPPRQQQPPSPPRQQQPPSPPRQQQPPSPPRHQTPPPPQERSPYHSPPSRHMSPPTPPKAASPSPPPPQPPRSSYMPPPSPKEVQEALPPRKPTSPPSPAHSTRSMKSESSESPRKAASPRVLSPYSLPPSQLHSERETTQKIILTAEKTSQLYEPNHHENQNYNHNHNQNQNHNHQGNNTKKTHHQQSSFSDSENIMGTRVITIAGENKGAVMEILRSPSNNKTGGTGPHSSRVLNGAGEKGRRLQSSSSSSSDEGEGKKKTTKNRNNTSNNSNLPMKAFMNSNVQMINNSIVYNSTATHHDPGVHLKISRKPGSGNGFHVTDYGDNGGGYTN